MGHSPSLRTEYALGAIFCPLGPRGYHFKALFREFPAILRPGTKTPNKSVKTDVRSYESWHFRLKITLGGLQNRFWAPKNNCEWPACWNCSSFLILGKKIAEIGPLYGPKTRRKWPNALKPRFSRLAAPLWTRLGGGGDGSSTIFFLSSKHNFSVQFLAIRPF